ncbi:hypothetical protein SCRM01_003 [Synechococcus phage S-CRM01]|uniref:hypothetical protein n=1 Tax=Synechococcus phage S-CRM01 TaxID=1026955 RepID=UPI000209E32D|nr:hypothetical protein SCRM01_003 [Synechococcus phage S-CRM01]AEC52952.1 hypothetical protein SCRM01_003 [Synechococcus phage S-CRM01]
MKNYTGPEPIAIKDRLPEPEDLKDGECWFYSAVNTIYQVWRLDYPEEIETQKRYCEDKYTHWLPWWALPILPLQGFDD